MLERRVARSFAWIILALAILAAIGAAHERYYVDALIGALIACVCIGVLRAI